MKTDKLVDSKVTTMTDLSGKKSKVLLLKNESEIEAFKKQLRLYSVVEYKSYGFEKTIDLLDAEIDSLKDAYHQETILDRKTVYSSMILETIKAKRQLQRKTIKIELKDWMYNCSDGCCTNYGTTTKVNGEEMPLINQDTGTILKIVLKHLGYEVELIEIYNNE